jgi:hypothetical protein
MPVFLWAGPSLDLHAQRIEDLFLYKASLHSVIEPAMIPLFFLGQFAAGRKQPVGNSAQDDPASPANLAKAEIA